MRTTVALLALAGLAACATPQQRCISQSSQQVRVLTGLVNETRANLARGYGIEELQEVRTVQRNCEGTNSDGSSFFFPCTQSETVTRQVPVALDLNAEREKLASLEERLAVERAEAQREIAQCQATYPE